MPRDAAGALGRSRQAVLRAVITGETVAGAGVLRKTGAAVVGAQAADETRIAGIGIVRTLVARAPLPRAAGGLARAYATGADVCPAAPAVIRAVAPLVGAAGLPGRAIAIPGAIHRRVGSHALVSAAAWFAGPSTAMVRGQVSQAAAGGRQQRAAPDQGTHEASP